MSVSVYCQPYRQTNHALTDLYLPMKDDLRLYVLLNSISVIWTDDNKRLCVMEPRFLLRRFHSNGARTVR